jgi:valine--pyruvate aminotransferase
MSRLDSLAREHGVPLIVDGAYGTPFPNLIFTEAEPTWNSNMILCLSLSKFGLPAARTGIVIADAPIISALSEVNAIMNLATGSFGSLMAQDLVQSKNILSLSNEVIRPFYLSRASRAQALLCELLQGLPFSIHKVEGAMFLWLWLKGCPISSQELYLRLKAKGVLVVSGHHFFPGLDSDDWRHKSECLRITYSQDAALVEKGLRIIGAEIRSVYDA